jgi:epoxyqueuosine reductase QueG
MKAWIHQTILDTIALFGQTPGVRTAWKDPLVAYADAADLLFMRLKEVVTPTHATPQELLSGAQTVIVYFLPFDESVGRSNRGDLPASLDWAKAYIETNQLIVAVNRRLAEGLEQQGYASVVLPPTHNFDQKELVSEWSHKHIGYIAGLGKFGLHRMLITENGCSGRLGSLVTRARLSPTPRSPEEACLYNYDKSCVACVKRCPVGALTESGYDRHACYAVCLQNAKTYESEGLADVCGKCASVVPCSFQDPVARVLKAHARPKPPAETVAPGE